MRHGLPASDIIAPNLVELEILCEHAVNNAEESARLWQPRGNSLRKGHKLCWLNTWRELVYSRDRFEMLLVTAGEAWHISRPLVDFGMRQPVGVGDVTSGLLLVKLLQGATLQEALEHVTAAVYEIMVTTKAMQEYELQVVAAQDRIAKPEHYFSATKPEIFIRACNNDGPSGRFRLLL
ncbi:pyridoxal kinase [Escherichia coli]|nr:pyridoxal kinase [Escherichia coli]